MSLVALRHYLTTNPRYLYSLVRDKYRRRMRCRWVDRYARTERAVPPPLVYKIALTDKCNLACKMCMNILDREAPKASQAHGDIDFALLTKLFSQVADARPSVILSGGEPMLYPRFAELVGILLESKHLSTNICTNGTVLRKYVPVLKNTRHIQLTVSLDGAQEANDAIRGPGVHDAVVSAIRELRQASRHRMYIGIQHTLRPENVGSMDLFCKSMVELDVDWILFNPCWHLSKEQADDYCSFMNKEYGITPQSQRGYVMDYPLDTAVFAEQFAKIQANRWPIQISCYYSNPVQTMQEVCADPSPTSGAGPCYKQWIRMDIMSDGKVVACQQFPDVVLGDLHRQEWHEIWNAEAFSSFRASILRRPLPVCTMCAPFYLYDKNRARL